MQGFIGGFDNLTVLLQQPGSGQQLFCKQGIASIVSKLPGSPAQPRAVGSAIPNGQAPAAWPPWWPAGAPARVGVPAAVGLVGLMNIVAAGSEPVTWPPVRGSPRGARPNAYLLALRPRASWRRLAGHLSVGVTCSRTCRSARSVPRWPLYHMMVARVDFGARASLPRRMQFNSKSRTRP